MTDDYQTGRFYSGVRPDDGERIFLIRKKVSFQYPWRSAYGDLLKDDEVTDVRGPLVVLDLHGVDVEYAVKMMRDCGCDVNVIAAQIEEQTRPPRKIGWHEVQHLTLAASRYWNGRLWHLSSGVVDAEQGWDSTHYIGPGSSDE